VDAECDVQRIVAARAGSNWCLFLDRDGVINRQIVNDYVRTWQQFEWLPDVPDALKKLRQWAPRLVVVTNQQGIGKQLMSEGDVASIHRHIQKNLAPVGVTIDAFQVCPHLASAKCDCRKPMPGLVLDWLARHPEVDPSLSLVVGDSPSDIELAHNVAVVTGECASIQIGSRGSSQYRADASFDSLWDFAAMVQCAMEGQDS